MVICDEISLGRLYWDDSTAGFFTTLDEAAKYCENLKHAGFDDWRVPDIYELFSITGGELSINESFKNFSESYYWSTTKQGFNDSSDEWFWILDFRSDISWGFMLTNEGLAKV